MFLKTFCRNCLNTHKLLNLRLCSTKRKKPIDTEEEEKLPIFEYPHGVSSDRRVYVSGLAKTGALGIERPKKSRGSEKNVLEFVRYPMRLSFAERHQITDVAAGFGFSAFVVKTKDISKVFGTGLNTDSQIGFHAPRAGYPLGVLMAPSPIFLPIKKREETKVIALAAGRSHLAIVTDKEGIFMLGNNAFGQCGRRPLPTEDYSGSMVVNSIPHIFNEKIVDAECGQDHSLFLSESGKVYACGWGTDGQTGQGHFENEWRPSPVTGDITSEKIVKVSSRADCVLALSDKGDLFGWGNTEYGQLSLGSDESQQINSSVHLGFTKSLGKIVDIAAGGSFCLVVNEFGDVFTWGFGLLGKGPDAQQSYKPEKIPSTLFGRNNFNPNVKVIKVACGLSHMAAITDDGDLFTWGRNMYGCLGLGHLKDQYFPLKAAIGAKVLKVSCGPDHMVMLTKPYA